MDKPPRPDMTDLALFTHGVVEYIEYLEARYVRDCEQITGLWERLGDYRSRIKELESSE